MIEIAGRLVAICSQKTPHLLAVTREVVARHAQVL